MASIKNLKKDTHYILADIIEECLLWQLENPKKNIKESEKIISDSIEAFDKIIAQINEKGITDKKVHFKTVINDLEKLVVILSERVEKL